MKRNHRKKRKKIHNRRKPIKKEKRGERRGKSQEFLKFDFIRFWSAFPFSFTPTV